MHKFSTVTGVISRDVDVEYDIDQDGKFKYLYVLIYSEDGPVDISTYLSAAQIDAIEYEAQMHFREYHMALAEKDILGKHAADDSISYFDGYLHQVVK